MLSLNAFVNEFFKVLQASRSSLVVRGLLSALALSQILVQTGWPADHRLSEGERFDFIVVGSGSAGAVIAARLSEVPYWRVLLIEAGGIPPPTSVIPSLFATLGNTEYDWKYKAHYDRGTGQAHVGGILPYTRGKVLGGSSSVNYLVYSRGVPEDYDDWNLIAPGWSWSNVLPYFKKLENMTDPSVFTPENADLHSTEGPVEVSRPEDNLVAAEINENMLRSYREIGIPTVLENNGRNILGAARPHFTFANGRRSSTAEAYLRLNNKPNLYVAQYTRATKVLIDPNTLEAYGVEVLQNGNKINVLADREVIVSAGTFDSPKLLMLSGIGPQEELQRIGIRPLKNLPVGKNMQDHPFVPLPFVGKKGLESSISNFLVPTQLDEFPVPFQCGFFKLFNDNTEYRDERPQYQFFNVFIGATAAPLVKFGCGIYGYQNEFCNSLAKNNFLRELNVMSLILLHPLSRGSVTLRSNNPLDDPYIELGYFREREDVYYLREGIKYMRQLENSTYFRENKGYLAQLEVASCEGLKWGSDGYWDCYVKSTAGAMLHAVGTCRMGPDGVVDERLRVHGIGRLRVADASIMPEIASGNTNAPAMMIGEKASDLIKEDHGLSTFEQYLQRDIYL